ncbi:MAG: PilZ domain-containing protein [Terriglobia bacterium]
MKCRRATRVRAKATIDVGFVGGDDKFTASLLDLSPFGLSVKTSREVKAGTIFKLGVRSGTDCFRAAAIVRALIPGGFAVEFLSMNPTDRELMRRDYARLQMAAREAKTG